MRTFWQFQLLLIAGMILYSESDVSLSVISSLGRTPINDLNVPVDFECNSEVSLVCEIKPYVDSAVWQVNGTTYSVCIFQKCYEYPPFPENHNFSMDMTNGFFNLTIDPVPISSNRSLYKCDDGNTARSVDAILKVYNTTLKMDTSTENQITVTTGCVYPNREEDMSFEWFLSKEKTTQEHESFSSRKNESTITFDCTETSACSGKGTAHFNNTVAFDVSDNGDEYYIYVTVKHNDVPNRRAVLFSDRTYKVKDRSKKNDCHVYIIVTIVLILRYQLLQTLFSGYQLQKAFTVGGLKHLTQKYNYVGFLASIPFAGLLFPIKSACKTEKAMNPAVTFGCTEIVVATLATLADPAIGIIINSLFYARTYMTYRDAITRWFIGLHICGCVFCIGLEIVSLVSCKVLCLDVKYHALFVILCVGFVWIYLVCIVIHLKRRIEQLDRRKDNEYKCNKCDGNPRNICQISKELMCDRCCKKHPVHHQKPRLGLDLDYIRQRNPANEHSCTCQTCSKPAVNGYCMKCELYLCVGCMQSHSKCGKGLLRHQQHNEEREKEFCCASCKKDGHIFAAHAYCLRCSAYSCTPCLKTKHKTCTLLWIQEQKVGTGHELCCERFENHREMPLEGVCLTCDSYICTGCLKNLTEHKNHVILSHQQEHGRTGRGRHICCNVNYSSEGKDTINYCLDCQMYLCIDCFSGHNKHSLFCDPSKEDDIFCKGCKKYKRLPVECYHLHHDELLCAKCFERGYKSPPWKRSISNDSNKRLLKERNKIRNQQRACQIHSVLGEAGATEVEVYCLVCKKYMCKGCFKRHRRIIEYWIKTQEGNLFYCNVCKNDEHMYPVEVCNLKTGKYICADCYECENHSYTGNYAAEQNEDVKLLTQALIRKATPCQIHKFPFQEHATEITGTVYCLVCKLYLCKHCFELHRRLKDVWQMQQLHGSQVPSEVVVSTRKSCIIPFAYHPDQSSSCQVSETNVGLIVWWHFPVAGIIIAALHWFCKLKRDQRKVEQEKNKT